MPVFTSKHHRALAELLGNLDRHDSIVQDLTERFGEFLEKDNERFNFKRFQSYVSRVREGRE
jgi:hypothetical protein